MLKTRSAKGNWQRRAAVLDDLSTAELEDLEQRLTKKLSTIGNLRWRRDLTEAEKRVDFVKLTATFDTAEQQMASALVPVLKKQQARLLDQSKNIIDKAKRNKGATLAADIDTLSAGFLGAYQSAAYGQIESIYQSGAQSVRQELGKGQRKAAGSMQGYLDQLKQLSDRMARDAAARITAKTGGSLFDALLPFVGLAADFGDVDPLDYIDSGASDTAAKLASEQARIATGKAINAGRDAASEEFDIKAAQWSALIDAKTCPLCKLLDNTRLPYEDRFTIPIMPGLVHWGECRCIWIWVLAGDPDAHDFNWVDPSEDLLLQYAPYLF